MALRALQLLGFAETAGMGQRDPFEYHRVRRVCSGPAGAPDQVLQEVERGRAFLGHLRHRFSGYFQMGLPEPGNP